MTRKAKDNGATFLVAAAFLLLAAWGTSAKGQSCDPWPGSVSWASIETVSDCLNTRDVNAESSLGVTALHLAVDENDVEKVVVLLRAGADPHHRTLLPPVQPLHRTLLAKSPPEIVTALLAHGADINAKASGYTLFELLERNDLWDILSRYRQASSSHAIADFKRREEAIIAGLQTQEQETLPSCDEWITLGFFERASAAEVARCLKAQDPNAKDGQGRTPVHLASLAGKPEIVEVLAEAGADLDPRDGKGRTPLHLVAYFGNTPEIVATLVKAGADLDARDAKGRTPLEFAEMFSETPAIVDTLREAVAEANAAVQTASNQANVGLVACREWNTPAFFRKATAEDVARCLETEDPNVRNQNGRTPMHYAAQGLSPSLVTTLAQAGAELNAPDDKGGWTPLHLAAWFSTTPSVVAALLAAGADAAAKDKAGKTPWDYARENAALEGTPPYWRLNEEGAE